MANWQESGSVVFGPAAAPTSWTDLDLSSVVGAKRSLVWLDMAPSTGGVETVSARPGDDTDDWHDADNTYGRGCANVNHNVSVADSGILVMTDDSGVIEWMSSASSTFTITVIGYVDDVQTYSGAAVSTGALTGSTWNNIDISSIVGSRKALVYLKIKATNAWSSNEYWFTRPHGSSGDWVNNQTSIYAAANKLNKADTDDAFGLLAVTDENGIIQIYSDLGTGQGDVFVIGYIDEDNAWNDPVSGEEVVFGPAAMPTTYADLDLSDAVGSQPAIVLLKLEQSGGNISNVSIKTRENGQSYDHQGGAYSAGCVNFRNNRASMLICPCDENGIIEWEASIAKAMTVTVVGFIPTNAPPEFSNQLPTAVGNKKPYVDVSFTVLDTDGQVDLNTIDVDFIRDPGGDDETFNVIIDGLFQPGYDGTFTVNGTGYDVLINEHPLLDADTWRVSASADDELGQTGSDTWDFTSNWDPELVSAIPIARRKVQVVWDLPVRCRALTVLPQDGEDRYTAVDWIALGGAVKDAQNPANYTFARPAGGTLDGLGEAVDLIPVRVDESEDHWYDESGIRYSDRVDVTVDFEQTAHANYRASVGVVSSPDDDSTSGDLDFIGFVASQVQRNTLTFFGSLSDYHRRLDREGTEELELFLTIWQEIMNRVLEDVDSFFWDLCDIDKARPEFLDNILYDLGNPFAGVFNLTVNQKRKLAAVLVQIYREKGTCQGIINVVQFFVGVTLSGCTDVWSGTWRLSDGTSGSPNPGTGGPFTLSDGTSGAPNPGSEQPCVLGPSSSSDVWSFRLISPIALSQEQKDMIEVIAEYMMPAACHYLGVIEP